MTHEEMTREERSEAIDAHCEGLEFVSTGPCPGCDECGLGDVDTMDCEEYELAGEPGFSWRSCDTCGSGLGGDRHPAHGVIRAGSMRPVATRTDAWPSEDLTTHMNICTDCLYAMEGLEDA